MFQESKQIARKCLESGCEKPYHSKGYCRNHYNKLPYVKELKRISMMNNTKVCCVDGCGRRHTGLGYCRIHYGCLPQVKARSNELRRGNPRQVELRRKYNRQLKFEVLSHYSNGILKCECCNESIMEFLTINHLNGNGNQHRKEIKAQGIGLYSFLKSRNYPSGFNVLCLNCNFAEGHYKICPHKEKQIIEVLN